MIDLNDITIANHCLVDDNAKSNKLGWLRHRSIGYASFHLIDKLIKMDLVVRIAHISFNEDKIYDACQLEKQTKKSFKSKNIIFTSRPLELLHLDLFGPTRITSLRCSKYGLVVVDDFSRFTWVSFLVHKDETFSSFIRILKRIMNEKNTMIVSIRSDHGSKF